VEAQPSVTLANCECQIDREDTLLGKWLHQRPQPMQLDSTRLQITHKAAEESSRTPWRFN
jgi:hypothetical protein